MWSWRCNETQCCAEHGRVVQSGHGGMSAVLQSGAWRCLAYTAVHDARVEPAGSAMRCNAMQCGVQTVYRAVQVGREVL